jgi:hypothetical protein
VATGSSSTTTGGKEFTRAGGIEDYLSIDGAGLFPLPLTTL